MISQIRVSLRMMWVKYHSRWRRVQRIRWLKSFHFMASSVRRVLFCWGNGDFGRLGMGANTLASVMAPTKCEALSGINMKNVACGGAHTVALTESGEVWTFGMNTEGQLGHSEGIEYVADPWMAQVPEKVVKVAAGHRHTLCLGESGSPWVWGSNMEGQLGLGSSCKTQGVPRKVEGVTGVEVAAGAAHSLLAMQTGEVFSWGRGTYGQLGHDPRSKGAFGGLNIPNEDYPRLIRDLRAYSVHTISAGHNYSGAIDRDGRVFLWGLDREYQLGLGDDKSAGIVPLPHRVEEVSGAASISLGASHSLAVRHGSAFAWGMNDSGVLGIKDIDHASVPVIIPDLAVKQVSAGWKHCAGVTTCGNLFAWGAGGSVGHPSGLYEIGMSSSGGQLGLGDDYDRLEPTEVKAFPPNLDCKWLQVSCGFNHTAAIAQIEA